MPRSCTALATGSRVPSPPRVTDGGQGGRLAGHVQALAAGEHAADLDGRIQLAVLGADGSDAQAQLAVGDEVCVSGSGIFRLPGADREPAGPLDMIFVKQEAAHA